MAHPSSNFPTFQLLRSAQLFLYPSWVFIYAFFSSRNGIPLPLLLVNPNLIQIKCHFLLEAFGWEPCTASQVQWTPEQHGFELPGSTYTGIFFHKYVLQYYMVRGCGTLDTGGLTVKLYFGCQRVGPPNTHAKFKGQLHNVNFCLYKYLVCRSPRKRGGSAWYKINFKYLLDGRMDRRKVICM